ncbi:MAG: glycosyltransferase family 9 protein [Bacteroidales bacterium]|nr:glycosyltransferase family 9 protein [Bacteroidales bacterium]MBR6930595.1 glycosyltransferase family 9 protein [Bacteroidales bacterium]
MKKLLIIRFSALGDIAMTVPVVHDLAVQYPDLEITMLSRPMAEPLFEQLPKNVHFLAADLKGRHKGMLGLERLRKDYHLEDFYYIADFHNVIRTICLRLDNQLRGQHVAVIDKGRKGKRALTRQKNKVFVQQANSFERYAKVLEQLGFPIKPQFVKLDYSSFCETQKATNETWIGIAPFAKHPAKVYPFEKMEEVIKALSERENTTVFLFGGGNEEKRQIAELCGKYPNVKTAQSQQGLKGELALMGQLDVMLSMDSANMHLASLVGTRVVSIWGGTHPYAGFLGWNQKAEDCIQSDLPCRPCSVYGNKPCFRGDYACLNGITPSQIIEKLVGHE